MNDVVFFRGDSPQKVLEGKTRKCFMMYEGERYVYDNVNHYSDAQLSKEIKHFIIENIPCDKGYTIVTWSYNDKALIGIEELKVIALDDIMKYLTGTGTMRNILYMLGEFVDPKDDHYNYSVLKYMSIIFNHLYCLTDELKYIINPASIHSKEMLRALLKSVYSVKSYTCLPDKVKDFILINVKRPWREEFIREWHYANLNNIVNNLQYPDEVNTESLLGQALELRELDGNSDVHLVMTHSKDLSADVTVSNMNYVRCTLDTYGLSNKKRKVKHARHYPDLNHASSAIVNKITRI